MPALDVKGLSDACTPVRTAYAIALGSVLANSVLTVQAGEDAKDKLLAQSRVSRMRRVDDDAGDASTGGDDKIKTAKSVKKKGGASHAPSPVPSTGSDPGAAARSKAAAEGVGRGSRVSLSSTPVALRSFPVLCCCAAVQRRHGKQPLQPALLLAASRSLWDPRCGTCLCCSGSVRSLLCALLLRLSRQQSLRIQLPLVLSLALMRWTGTKCPLTTA